MRPARLATAFLGAVFIASATATPPAVLETDPGNGDRTVSPALTEIRVVFDQAMDEGSSYSVTGGGETFPEITGSPSWKNARTFALPVRLKPAHTYRLGINSPSHTNFKNKRGEPAIPYPIEFRTQASPGSPPSPPPGDLAADNAASIRELRRALEERYSYRDLRVRDWDAQFARFQSELAEAPDVATFAESAAALLAPAADAHIWLRAGAGPDAKIIPSFRRRVTPNFDFASLPKVVPELVRHNETLSSGRFPGGVAYLLITDWSAEREKDFAPAYALLARLAESESLVIDVRPNAGGAEPLAQQFAGCFIDKPVTYARHAYRDPGAPGGFGGITERILSPAPDRPAFRGRIAVLMGPVNMSSCEAFLLMMKQVPNCALVGARSYGSSGNPKPHPLANGVTVYLPSWRAMDAEGNLIESVGIAPEIAVPWEPSKADPDPVLKKALELLSSTAARSR